MEWTSIHAVLPELGETVFWPGVSKGKVCEYDMAKEYVVIAVDRSKQPPLEYRIVKRGK
jgi:hypothetical protein